MTEVDPIAEMVMAARKTLEQTIGVMPGDQPTDLGDLKGRIMATRDLTRTLNQLVRDLADTVQFMIEREKEPFDPLVPEYEHLRHSQAAIWMGCDYLDRAVQRTHGMNRIRTPAWYEAPARRSSHERPDR